MILTHSVWSAVIFFQHTQAIHVWVQILLIQFIQYILKGAKRICFCRSLFGIVICISFFLDIPPNPYLVFYFRRNGYLFICWFWQFSLFQLRDWANWICFCSSLFCVFCWVCIPKGEWRGREGLGVRVRVRVRVRSLEIWVLDSLCCAARVLKLFKGVVHFIKEDNSYLSW
jgi:hypothetical protein